MGEKNFQGKYLNGCKRYQMQFGLIQQYYVTTDYFAYPVTRNNATQLELAHATLSLTMVALVLAHAALSLTTQYNGCT